MRGCDNSNIKYLFNFKDVPNLIDDLIVLTKIFGFNMIIKGNWYIKSFSIHVA